MYRNIINLEEEVNRLNKFIVEKEDKLEQVQEKLRIQESELSHHQ